MFFTRALLRSSACVLSCSIGLFAHGQTPTQGENELPDEIAQLIVDYRYAEAFPGLVRLSSLGNQAATFMLGNYHVCGRVVPFDCQEAERHFELTLIARNQSPLDPEILRRSKNEIAWLHASCEQPGFVRNLPMAMMFAKAAVTDEWDPFAIDTLAAVHARAGEYDVAVEIQRRAVGELTKMPTSPPVPQYTLDEFSSRVAKYQAREPAKLDESNYKQNCNTLPEKP
jgi:hypothetical protein